jgi:RNA polymerase sigma factor (sigma-70 family)
VARQPDHLRRPRFDDEQVGLAAFRAPVGLECQGLRDLAQIVPHAGKSLSRAARSTAERLTRRAELPDPAPSPPDVLDQAQLQRALVACLRELDDKLRTVLLLRFQQGFSYEEMAVVCGEKAGTLHARVARALPDLRVRIEHRLGARGIISRR